MKGKHEKKKVQIFELYSVLLLVATLVMSMAYAEMSGTMMSVSTNTEVEAQTGVFITEVTTSDEVNAIVNNYIATVMDSSITLASSGDTKTFNIKVYNSTNKPQVFIDIIKLDETYDNAKIACTLSENIVPKTTILQPKSFITFSVTLSYTGSDTPTGELRSMLNFRFQEVPTIKITPNGAIENIYPDYTPSEYTFIVENANENATNGVPLTYKLSANISAPFIAKIYNESGTEVKSTDTISLSGDGSNVTHTYKLKILWDNSNPESGKEYNSVEYANKSYNCKINLIATPTDENNKYLGYQLKQEESINVTTAPLYFNTSIDKQTVEMNNNKAEVILTVNNNNGTNYNKFEIQYKISIDNTKFTLKVDGSEIGENTITLGNTAKISQNHGVELIPKNLATLNKEEICNITIQTTKPYIKTETIQIKITDTTGPTAPEITGGSSTFKTSQTISVSKLATDTGTGIGKYQYLVNADGTTSAVATADVGSTENETSKTFNTEYNGEYIYFRAVDKVGNVGEWSNAQQLFIDKGTPTITLGTNSNTTWSKTGSVTVKIKDEVSGLAEGANIKYGWSTSNTTAPSSYTQATLTYTVGTKNEVTFTATAEGLTGKYYLWVVPTTLKDTAGNTQTQNVISTGTFYFDNTDPTAGTLTMKLGSSSGSDYTNDSWTNQSVYVAVNDGSDGSGESGHSSTTWKLDGTAQSGTSATLDPGSGKSSTYSVVVTTTDVAGNTASNSYTIKIDKVGPTAPGITGGNTSSSWATSRTISVNTASTDTGIGTVSYYEYCALSNSTAPTAATAGTKVTTTATSQTFNTNYNGYYVYFRGVDGLGNKGTWSSAERLYIDINKPTVTAKQASLTITQGQSYAMSNYFTVSQNGNAGISSTTYKEGSTTVSNTSSLSVGTHTITCTATKANGLSNSASMKVVVNSAVPTGSIKLYRGNSFTVPENVWVVYINSDGFPTPKSNYCRVKPGQSHTFTTREYGGMYTCYIDDLYIGKMNLSDNLPVIISWSPDINSHDASCTIVKY